MNRPEPKFKKVDKWVYGEVKEIELIGILNSKKTYNKNEIEDKNENNINPKVQSIKNKKIWSAASTHPGEEIFFLKTHLELKKII